MMLSIPMFGQKLGQLSSVVRKQPQPNGITNQSPIEKVTPLAPLKQDTVQFGNDDEYWD